MEEITNVDVMVDKIHIPRTKNGVLIIYSDKSGAVIETVFENAKFSSFLNPSQKKRLKEVL